MQGTGSSMNRRGSEFLKKGHPQNQFLVVSWIFAMGNCIFNTNLSLVSKMETEYNKIGANSG
jgi:hypothetical protein